MELYKGVFQISSLYGGRNLFQYLLVGERMVLLDSGIAQTPETAILPYIERLGHSPTKLSMVITTHPDMDHQGGNAALKQAAPRALFACGEADRQLVEDPKELYTRRYNYLRPEHGVGLDAEPPSDAGSRCRVDVGLRGGEQIALADSWDVEVLHVPGHSGGHLAIYDRAHRTAFVSDAIHGHGCPKADGAMAIPVTYYQVDRYLATLRHLETLALDALHTGHWPSMHGEEITDFFADSRRTVERLDNAIRRSLRLRPRTLAQLVDEVSSEFPEWPAATRILAIFSVNGHLERMEEKGIVRRNGAHRPVEWELI